MVANYTTEAKNLQGTRVNVLRVLDVICTTQVKRPSHISYNNDDKEMRLRQD
jgi:hypothetical protein